MGVLSGLMQRFSPENPRVSLSAWMDSLGATPTAAGARINQSTALTLSAVWAATRVLADTIAATPLVTYRRLDRGKERSTDHPLYRVLHDQANPEMSAFTFKEVLAAHVVLWGNAFAEIEETNGGRVVGLWPLPPTTEVERVDGRKRYLVDVPGQGRVVLGADRVLHIIGLGFDGLRGYSVVTMARESLGLTAAAEEYGARYFGQGARASGVIEHPGQLSAEAQKRLRESWTEMHSGLQNAHRTAILEEGMKWQQLSIPPEDSQFLQTRKFQTTEVARWFRVPPHMLGDLEKATYSNIEQQSIEFVQHTMLPWFRRWEQAIHGSALLSDIDRPRIFAEFNVEGLLRGDSQARAEFYAKMWGIGALSINQILEAENQNTIDGGDERFVPVNMVPLSKAGEPAEPEPTPEPPERQRPVPSYVRLRDTLVPVFQDAAGRVVWRETMQLRKHVEKWQARSLPELELWLADFYQTFRAYVAQQFTAAIETTLRSVGVVDQAVATELAGALADRWVTESRQTLAARLAACRQEPRAGVLAHLDDWQAMRAAATASEEVARIGLAALAHSGGNDAGD